MAKSISKMNNIFDKSNKTVNWSSDNVTKHQFVTEHPQLAKSIRKIIWQTPDILSSCVEQCSSKNVTENQNLYKKYKQNEPIQCKNTSQTTTAHKNIKINQNRGDQKIIDFSQILPKFFPNFSLHKKNTSDELMVLFTNNLNLKISQFLNSPILCICFVCQKIIFDEKQIDDHLQSHKYKKVKTSSNNLSEILFCAKCDYQTPKKSNWKRHMLSKKHNKINEQIEYYCEDCNYSTRVKCNYEKHVHTSKHRLKQQISHKLNKNQGNEIQVKDLDGENQQEVSNIVLSLFEESRELKKILISQHNENIEYKMNVSDISEKISNLEHTILDYRDNTKQNIIVNQVNNTNNYNTINNILNYLNTECKDAMNMSDFINNLKITYDDLLYLKDHGQAKTFERTLLRELKGTDINKRPIHCTDHKRKKFFIKEDNIWEKEDNDPYCKKSKINKMLRSVHMKQIEVLQNQKKMTPHWLDDDKLLMEYNDITSKLSTLYDGKEQKKIINKLTNNVIL